MSCGVSQVFWQGNSLVVLARIVGLNQVAITQASLSGTIGRTVANVNTKLAGDATALVVADTVFNSLQTDYGWDQDSTGYNFRDIISGANFPLGDVPYQIQYAATDTSSRPLVFAMNVRTDRIF